MIVWSLQRDILDKVGFSYVYRVASLHGLHHMSRQYGLLTLHIGHKVVDSHLEWPAEITCHANLVFIKVQIRHKVL